MPPSTSATPLTVESLSAQGGMIVLSSTTHDSPPSTPASASR